MATYIFVHLFHFGDRIYNSFMECATQVWDVAYLAQLNRATVRLYNSFIHCNSPLLQKVFHADIELSSRIPSCWTSH
eukprot:468669-Pelagomonas_calceolata.AAC.1